MFNSGRLFGSKARRPVAGLLRAGFTLTELLIVIFILGILAAIVFPKYKSLNDEARAKSAAANVRTVREMIELHVNSGRYPLTASGFPTQIFADWFRSSEIPEHPWTRASFKIETIAAGSNVLYPAVKTFDINDNTALNAWYNTDNGHFMVRIPPQSNDLDTLQLFNQVNMTRVLNLGDTQ